jgi:hypothetical protein
MEDYDEYFAELNPLEDILGRASAEARRSALPIGLDTLAFMASGMGLPKAFKAALQMEYGPRFTRSLITRPSGPRLEYIGGAVPTTGVGQLINPEDLISITDERGADTGFSEYSSPGVAASYEGSS